MQKFSIKKFLPYIWLVLPLVTLVLAAQTAQRKSLNAEEYAYACDQFGYLRMAKEIRHAVSQRKAPEFKIESDQTRQLIEFMKSNHVPLPKWEEVVGPHAHHYFPASDAVGVQYPPGTGLTLAIFPEDRAIYDLNRVVGGRAGDCSCRLETRVEICGACDPRRANRTKYPGQSRHGEFFD